MNKQFSFFSLPTPNHQIGFWQQVGQFLAPGLRAPGASRTSLQAPREENGHGGRAEGTSPGSACGLRVYNLLSLFVFLLLLFFKVLTLRPLAHWFSLAEQRLPENSLCGQKGGARSGMLEGFSILSLPSLLSSPSNRKNAAALILWRYHISPSFALFLEGAVSSSDCTNCLLDTVGFRSPSAPHKHPEVETRLKGFQHLITTASKAIVIPTRSWAP